MHFEIGDVILLKKGHPCGANAWKILRVGMDFRLECQGCGHQIMIPRKQVEKNFKGKLPEGKERDFAEKDQGKIKKNK